MTEITAEDRWRACRKLAELQGWRDLQPYGQYGHMMGRKEGYTGMVIVPLPTESWSQCADLIADNLIGLDFSLPGHVLATGAPGPMAFVRHPSVDYAIRYAVVVARIKQLEQQLPQQEAANG